MGHMTPRTRHHADVFGPELLHRVTNDREERLELHRPSGGRFRVVLTDEVGVGGFVAREGDGVVPPSPRQSGAGGKHVLPTQVDEVGEAFVTPLPHLLVDHRQVRIRRAQPDENHRGPVAVVQGVFDSVPFLGCVQAG